MAAIWIIIAGLLAVIVRYSIDPGQPNERYIEFGSNLINVLSICWILIVLYRNERKNDELFGRALRRELSTIFLMVFVSGAYSLLSVLRAL